MYKIKGTYYIWLTNAWAGQYVLKSDIGPFGPYERRKVIGEMRAPIVGAGPPHQGGLVDTPDGRWYYMSFVDAFPAGRVPALAPVEFDEDGWPRVVGDYSDEDGQWRAEYPLVHDIDVPQKPKTNITRSSFGHGELNHRWQWNQSPDDLKWSARQGQLVLETATVTDCLFLAANTLTHRTIGPTSNATFCLNCVGLIDGDRAGASLFRNQSAYIGVHKDGDETELVYVDDLELAPVKDLIGWKDGHPVSQDWGVVSKGSIKVGIPLAQGRIWLRIHASVDAASSDGYEKEPRQASFHYSYDGKAFTQLGPLFTMDNSAIGWMGYRFAVFNFATKDLGGQLVVENCEIEVADRRASQ